jgi:hypothetical protein
LSMPCFGFCAQVHLGAIFHRHLGFGIAYLYGSTAGQRRAFGRVFQSVSGGPSFEHIMIDATIVRAHQHAAGAKGGLKTKRLADRVAA